MLIDITLKITNEMAAQRAKNSSRPLAGHVGTHFDVMNKAFPLEYTERKGYIFDVRGLSGREIGLSDVDMSRVEEGMFVGFCTSFIEKVGYSTPEYHAEQPYLSFEQIDSHIVRSTHLSKSLLC